MNLQNLQIREALLAQQEISLAKEIGGQLFRPREQTDTGKDLVDNTQFDRAEAERLRSKEEKTKTLNLIQRALDLIRAGWDGRCRECEEQISDKRLEALPYATCCTECAEKKEQERAGIFKRENRCGCRPKHESASKRAERDRRLSSI